MIHLGRLPKGLLDLIGASNFGKAPGEFLEEVRGIVDIGPMLACGQILIDGGSSVAGFAAGAFNAVAQVPQGVIRFYHDVSLTLELGAAAIGQARIASQVTGNTVANLRCGHSPVIGSAAAPGAATAYGTNQHFAPPLLQPPGFQLGFEVFTAIPAGARIHLGLQYADYRGGG